VKKSVYCLSGTLLIIVAAVLRSIAGGGGESFALALLGLLMIIASADVPPKRTVH
jgi:hypothetical protein